MAEKKQADGFRRPPVDHIILMRHKKYLWTLSEWYPSFLRIFRNQPMDAPKVRKYHAPPMRATNARAQYTYLPRG